MKGKFLWMSLGSLITILILASYTFLTSYEKNVDRMLKIAVSYKGETLYTDLSSDVCGYLTSSKKTEMYFGVLPPQDNSIQINAPDRATLYVYPLDEDSIIVRYEPRGGIKRNYKKSGFEDFNRILEVFYELTGNEIFNEDVEY